MKKWCVPAAAVLVNGLMTADLNAGEVTRHFPTARCKYTLPNDDWSWQEPNHKKQLFSARGLGGSVIFLCSSETLPTTQLDQTFVDEFEREYFGPGKAEKKGGRFTSFQGLPCYEMDGLTPEGLAEHSLLFIANSRAYNLVLLSMASSTDQVKQFEVALGGFEFDQPPTAPTPNAHTRYGSAELAADVVVVGLPIAVVLLLVRRLLRSGRSR